MILSFRLTVLLSIWNLVSTQQIQVPLQNHRPSHHSKTDSHTDPHTDVQERLWPFNFSSQAPHLFSSVHGLLQQWSNTFFPNGHSVVPCEIAAYTNLYHGRRDADLPPSPEWFAFDIEMSYGIMGSGRNSHLLTYQTTRPVSCLYFDGESATLMGSGQMDALNLFIYGNITGPPNLGRGPGRGRGGLADEYDRATRICDWIRERRLGGLGWGVEGIVRMNAGFEMIWCNFTSPSLRLMTRVNVTVPLLAENQDQDQNQDEVEVEHEGYEDTVGVASPTSYYPLPTQTSPPDQSTDPPNPPLPPNWRREIREPFLTSQTWGWFESATWHYGSSGMGAGRGDTRIKPVTCGFLSFYNPYFTQQQLARAAVEQKTLNLTVDGYWLGPGDDGNRQVALEQLMRRRRNHVLHNVSQSDSLSMNAAAERVLRSHFRVGDSAACGARGSCQCAGIDWNLVSDDIVQRYAVRLRQLSSLLESGLTQANNTSNGTTALRDWFVRLRHNTHSLLLPYLEYPDVENSPNVNDSDSWSIASPTGQLSLSRCQFHYTRLLAPDQQTNLQPEEYLLKWAVEETLGNICLVVVDVGLAVEREWLYRFHNGLHKMFEIVNETGIGMEIRRWKKGVEELMAWLGWVDQWTGCKEGCQWDETCFIPMWPLNFIGSDGSRRYQEVPVYDRPPHHCPDGDPDGGGRGPPGYGDDCGRGTFPPGPHRPPPFWGNEDSLWEPKCIKAEYMR